MAAALLLRGRQDVREGDLGVELDALHQADDAAGHALERQLLGPQPRQVTVHQ